MFSIFKRKPPAPSPNAVTNVLHVTPQIPDTESFRALFVRQGMWASTDLGVGIVTSAHPADNAVGVMLVDEKGLNKLAVVVDRSTVTQAKYLQIPEARRPAIEQARVKGYV